MPDVENLHALRFLVNRVVHVQRRMEKPPDSRKGMNRRAQKRQFPQQINMI
jgi:hypothetical protein